MDWVKSATQTPFTNITSTVSFRSEQKPSKDFDFTNEVIQNLKKNYHER